MGGRYWQVSENGIIVEPLISRSDRDDALVRFTRQYSREKVVTEVPSNIRFRVVKDVAVSNAKAIKDLMQKGWKFGIPIVGDHGKYIAEKGLTRYETTALSYEEGIAQCIRQAQAVEAAQNQSEGVADNGNEGADV